MTEVQALALLLAAIYLAEQTLRVLSEAIVFRRRIGGGWEAIRARAWSNFSGKALVLAPLVPPLRGVVVATPWPVSLSPEGVLAWPVDRQPSAEDRGTLVRWEDVRETDVDGSKVLVNGAAFADASTGALADVLADLIADVASKPASEREVRIAAEIDASLDAVAAKARVAEWEDRRTVPALASHAVFSLVASAVLLMVWGGTSPLIWLSLLVLALPVHLLGVWAFVRAHRALHPHRARERRTAAAVLAVAPFESAHMDTYLSKDLVPFVHGSAVAAALGDDALRRDLAAAACRRLRHATTDERPPSADGVRVWDWHRALVVAALLGRHPELEMDPAPAGPRGDARSRCPRCLALHARATGECADCAGVDLVPLA